MAKEKILVVDDDEDIIELLKFILCRERYAMTAAATGKEAVKIIRSVPPDLVVLDVMLPDIDGLEFIKLLKSDSNTRVIPIILLTTMADEADIVLGLEIGADDYISKPFSPRVFLARLRALLRAGANGPSDDEKSKIRTRNILVHPGRHEVRVNGKAVNLTFSEFAILNHLVRRPGWVFDRLQILNVIHGENHSAGMRSVDAQIVGLRKKLGPAGKCIKTVRGVGYRFRE